MLRNGCFLLVFILSVQRLSAQHFTVSGKITNNKLEPLALVSIQVKDVQAGTLTNENGMYELKLEEGKYDLVFTMIGFKSQVITLLVTKNYVQNIILETDDIKNLSEVIVKSKGKDKSEEIIRNVIRQKETILAASGAYSCNVYIKATQEDSMPRRNKNKKPLPDSLAKKNPAAGFQGMAMAEISLHYDHETDNRVKEERTGVVKRGNPESLFFLSLTEGNFNLYNNLLESRGLSQVPFLSPVSYSGLAAYKYKMISVQQSGNRKIYTISIKPKQLSNVTVEGELTILDSAWVILNAHFRLPGYHIPEYDFFEISQQYSLIDNKAWMITRQQFIYYSKSGKGKLSGETIAAYRDFELNKTFPRKHFGVELSATTQDAYEKDSLFWQKTRTEPLTPKEIRFIQYRDSMYRVTHAKVFLDSLDRSINKVTWKKLLFFGQTNYNREKQRTWQFPTINSLYTPFEFGGGRVSIYLNYLKTYPSRKNLSIYNNLSYGFRNHDINGNIRLTRMYNPFNRGFYQVALTRDFQYIFQGDAWINMIRRNNFYLNNGIGLYHGVELLNGLFLYSNLDIAFRRSLSNYKTNDKFDSLVSNIIDNGRAVAFDPYNAFYSKLTLKYTPAQRYIREPKEKIILGSKWPTFYVSWRKGIPGPFNSKVNFDYLEWGIEQELKLGITGVSKYTVKTGSFINKTDLRFVDYKFQRRGDPLLFMNPNEAFQSLDSTFPIFNRFYEAHYVHEFNGAILNKIPLFKKLQLREIAGGGFLIAPERNLRYAELFAGVERVFKVPFAPLVKFKLGAYVIGSAANQSRDPIQFKIGITSWDRKMNKWF